MPEDHKETPRSVCSILVELDFSTGATHLVVSDNVSIVTALGLLRLGEAIILERAKEQKQEKPRLVVPCSPISPPSGYN